jgi:hypothetical protein
MLIPIPAVPRSAHDQQRARFDQAVSANLRRIANTIGGGCSYGKFVSTVDQTPVAIDTAQAVTFDRTVQSKNVVMASSTSKIITRNPGVYDFSFSAQVKSTSSSLRNLWFWPRLNGINVPFSATKISIESNSAAIVPAWNFLFTMLENDVFELYWAASSLNVRLDADVADTFRPSVPSVILVVAQVGRLE